MRLGGVAFDDDVKWADGPEEQATKANIKAAIGSDGPAPGRFVSSLLREVIGIGRMDPSSTARRRKAMELAVQRATGALRTRSDSNKRGGHFVGMDHLPARLLAKDNRQR